MQVLRSQQRDRWCRRICRRNRGPIKLIRHSYGAVKWWSDKISRPYRTFGRVSLCVCWMDGRESLDLGASCSSADLGEQVHTQVHRCRKVKPYIEEPGEGRNRLHTSTPPSNSPAPRSILSKKDTAVSSGMRKKKRIASAWIAKSEEETRMGEIFSSAMVLCEHNHFSPAGFGLDPKRMMNVCESPAGGS